MLYFIGLGLGDAKDVTVRGMEVIRNCARVYLEAYTSILSVGKEALEEFYGRELILADRETVEQEADEILRDAAVSDVAFLVVGDPFGQYYTFSFQLYNFGETVSVVFWTDTWKPESFYDKIKRNRLSGMHTLCLLDIKVKEQSIENLMKGKKVFEPPRYMTVNQAVDQLLEIIQNRRVLGEELALTESTICVGLARVGSSHQKISAGTLQQLSTVDFGGPLHSLVISGCMHPLELDMLKLFAVDQSIFEQINIEDSSTYLS
ncbi:hypothetical protein GDO86_007638 [Hymenochirus boettgeri]|uniref:diphthine methyl ester synthase n=1 Tax=Hymenochirus boettgeri TaxID=247094 RepID=A0A8T2IY77_9PIPI|nr:hypothetical protein GDO86_007638 [Hymenochirus boettgeri]